MSTRLEETPEREIFGKVIKRWFTQNSWPQAVPERWAKQVGSPGPWASQMSQCMNKGQIDPKPAFFVAMGNFNAAVVERDWRPFAEDRWVVDHLKDATPLCHDNGVPFDGADFFRLYVGQLKPPSSMGSFSLDEFSDLGAEEFSIAAAATFQQLAREEMLSARDLWQRLLKTSALAGQPPELLEIMADMMRGEKVLSGAELTGGYEMAGQKCVGLLALEEVKGRKIIPLAEKLEAARIA